MIQARLWCGKREQWTGATLAAKMSLELSRMTLLRLVRATLETPQAAAHVVKVDDFALKRGHIDGTVMIDMATDRPTESSRAVVGNR